MLNNGFMTTQQTTTTNQMTGTVTVRTVSVKRIGSQVLVVKEHASKDRNGFTDVNSVIVCQGSARKVQTYLNENGLALSIPVVR